MKDKIEPNDLLSKSGEVQSEEKELRIVQSVESSTGNMREGRVRKLPLLSAMNEHPIII